MQVIKQPGETRLFNLPAGLDAGRRIESVDAVNAAPKGLAVETAALAVSVYAYDASVVQLRISGGTDGEIYLITATVTDDLGNVGEADGELHLVDLSFTSPADGSAVTYIEPSAYLDRFGLEETIALTDEARLGRVDARRLFAALADAAAEIDGYLAKRYAIPLDPAPALVARIAGDIARARLHAFGETPDVVSGALADARAKLKDIAGGLIELQGASAIETPSGAPVSRPGANRPFSGTALNGFGG